MFCLRSSILILFFSIAGLTVTPTSFAQSTPDDVFELYLTFSYRGVINNYVTAYNDGENFFLPVNELFSLFQIDVNNEGTIIYGNFGTEQVPYRIDLNEQQITYGDKVYPLDVANYYLSELDINLTPELYSQVFGLNFTINFNALSLNLVTDKELPSVERAIREANRQVSDLNYGYSDYYPLKLGQDVDLINGGFADYSLSTFVNPRNTAFNYNTSFGLQLIGGDLQGTVFGNYANNINSIQANNLRWQYVIRNTPWITRVSVGQANLDGVLQNQYTGIRLTNEPIEPRRFFDEFEIEGKTFPQSEVELYMNNSLIDFQEADAIGNYRFLTPVYYGTSQLDVRIYGPNGQIIERNNSVQIPFNFIPKGEVNYFVNAGYLNNFFVGEVSQSFATQATTVFGLTNWLSGNVGYEYFERQNQEDVTTFTAGASSRVGSNIILNGEYVSDVYVRGSVNAVYPNAGSIAIDYTNFTSNSAVYNNSGLDYQLSVNSFFPIQLFNVPFSLRLASFIRQRPDQFSNRVRADLNARFNALNIRVGYNDQLVNTYNPFDLSPLAFLESSATYNISRDPNIPEFFQSMFFRIQSRYSPGQNRFESAEMLVSRNIFRTGRVQLAAGRNFFGQFNTLRFNFIVNLDKVRSNTTSSLIGDQFAVTQNFQGSVGYDTNYDNFIFSNQNQVGRSGTAIQMFVDNNNNQTFEDSVDTVIPDAQMRLGRTGSQPIYKNGILYYTQMLPYFRYNMEMNTSSVKNPMLVPELDKFSIITDPNTFKKIEVPFYMAGVMDGEVLRQFENERTQGIGGLKLLLSSTDGELSKELRTFSDGSFYDYPLPPGDYVVRVDPKQLDLLGSYSEPERIEFTVDAIPEGDFIEGIKFTLIPGLRPEEKPEEDDNISISSLTEEIKDIPEIRSFENSLATRVGDALKLLVAAQEAFYDNRISRALSLVDESLAAFETAQGYALKGSLYFFRGNRQEALKNWNMAVRYDPNIYIPDMEYLEENIIISSTPEDE